MEQFKSKFIDEAQDLIQELEETSLELSSDPQNTAHIEVIFRSMHSLKGGSAMFGFDKIDTFTHQLETVYDKVRSGKMSVSASLIDLTFLAIDHIKVLLEEDDDLSDETINTHEKLLKDISELLDVSQPNTISSGDTTDKQGNDSEFATYYIKFVPKSDIMKNGTNPLLIVNELVSLGEAKTFAYTDKIPEYPDLDELSCYTYWVVILQTGEPEDEIRDVFMFVDMDCDLSIKKLSDTRLLHELDFISGLDKIYHSEKGLDFDNTSALIPVKKTENSGDTKDETASKISRHHKEQRISSIRVSSEKLDELISLVSELVTRQASLTLISEKINDKELITVSEDIDKITRRLRDSTFSIRLIPVDNMVTRFQRLIRELSQELEKEIVFETEGTDTELDKTIIESLIDPLMHIIRNSIDHGIETPEERKSIGKPAKGKIKFKAFYSGANVYIEVSDDGKGINIEKIREAAIKKDLISKDADLSEKEILDLLFHPGFSTAKNVTKVSGRGVGMDVVKRKISELRGEVSISTKENEGTSMTIKLPLTLSIIDGLLVRIDQTHYVIPLASVDKCFEFKHDDLMGAINNMIFVNDGHIPFAYLRKEFEINTPPPDVEQVIAIEYDDMMFGLAVDHVVGEYQAVLTTLGKMFIDQDIISGATILGDGTVALVVDPNTIISQFEYSKDESIEYVK